MDQKTNASHNQQHQCGKAVYQEGERDGKLVETDPTKKIDRLRGGACHKTAKDYQRDQKRYQNH